MRLLPRLVAIALCLLWLGPVWGQASKVAEVWQSGGRLAPVTASTTSGTTAVALPTPGNVAWVCDSGAQDVYVAVGGSSISVTTSTGSWLMHGTCAAYDLTHGNVGQAYGYLAAITSFSTTTLEIETGTGTPPGISSHLFGTTPQYSSAGTGQYALNVNSATALTVPAGATLAEVCVESQAVRYRDDGVAPTSASGIPVAAGSCYQYSGPTLLAAVQFIAQTAGATLDVSYYR
jgi:hypothetical protein